MEAHLMRNAVVLAAAFALALGADAQMKNAVKPSAQGTAPAPKANAQPMKPIPVQRQSLDQVRRISVAEANKLVTQGKAVLVDVRSKEQFDLGHIKGALHIPGSQLMSRLREVPPGKMIITYCACSAEQSSGRAVIDLAAHNVKNSAALQGGWVAWKDAGLPTEKSR
jgi:rhodanese-related sulfurtransferase